MSSKCVGYLLVSLSLLLRRSSDNYFGGIFAVPIDPLEAVVHFKGVVLWRT